MVVSCLCSHLAVFNYFITNDNLETNKYKNYCLIAAGHRVLHML